MGTKTAFRSCLATAAASTTHYSRASRSHNSCFAAFSSEASPPTDTVRNPSKDAAPRTLNSIDPPVPQTSQQNFPSSPRFSQAQRPVPAPRQSPQTASPPAPPGTDYLSLFQPSYGNALTGTSAYSPGKVLKVYPLPRHILKEDIIHHLRDSNVKAENVKLVYNPMFWPDYVQIEVDPATTQRLMKRLQERARLGCRFLRADVSAPMPWTIADAALRDAPRGRTLIMWNVHPSTDIEDVERFFQGYNYDASCIRMINVSNERVQSRGPTRRSGPVHVAVGFSTKLEALRAMREKSGDFCVNVAINLKFIQ